MMKDIKRRLTELEKKQRMKESRKKYEDAHPERKAYYRSSEWHEIRRKYYKNDPERIMRQRLNSAANLLYKHGFIDELTYAKIKEQVKERKGL